MKIVSSSTHLIVMRLIAILFLPAMYAEAQDKTRSSNNISTSNSSASLLLQQSSVGNDSYETITIILLMIMIYCVEE
ncbi:MAG TPA: hypothetical protein VE548_14530 [Nitrososphaeraceae archaeon]|nr:hypothetical protein [Nitrososphaeraceae archaeon]